MTDLAALLAGIVLGLAVGVLVTVLLAGLGVLVVRDVMAIWAGR